MAKHILTATGLALFAIGLVTGCASSAPQGPSSFVVPVPTVSEADYVIQRRDTLTVRFASHPDHDVARVLVRDDGKITLPLIGDVKAAGLTPPELSKELIQLYSTNLRNPSIAVNVKDVEEELIWVGGEVRNVGFVRYKPGMTASQALVGAGGPRDTADITDCVLLKRTGPDEYSASKMNLAKIIEEGDTKADLFLGPRDVLIVPMSGAAKANLWVRQYIINMLPIQFTYRLPDPNSSSPDQSQQSTSQAVRPSTGGNSSGGSGSGGNSSGGTGGGSNQ